MNPLLERANKPFIKFLLVGVINTLFGFSVYSLFITIGFHFTLASLISTIFGMLFNFKTIGVLVFKSKNNTLIFRFIVVYIIQYLLNVSFLKVMDSFQMNMILSGAIILLPLAVLSFLLNKKYVFRVNNQ
jgi:putative flippase GtrA